MSTKPNHFQGFTYFRPLSQVLWFDAIGAFLQTPAPVLDKISGPMGARFLSSAGLRSGNLIGRAQFPPAPALEQKSFSQNIIALGRLATWNIEKLQVETLAHKRTIDRTRGWRLLDRAQGCTSERQRLEYCTICLYHWWTENCYIKSRCFSELITVDAI